MRHQIGVILSCLALASAGNYQECSANFCQQGGQCLVMSGSPSPFDAYADDVDTTTTRTTTRQEFEVSPIQLDFHRAKQFCESRKSHLVEITENSKHILGKAEEFLGAQDVMGSFWVDRGKRKRNNLCWSLSSSDLVLRPSGCRKSRGFYALCQSDGDFEEFEKGYPALRPIMGHRKQKSMNPRQEEDNSGYPYYYSCQCPQGFGYENCTEPTGGADDADGSAGATYCVTEDYTSMEAPTIVEEEVLFIDHAAYGRPFLGFLSASSPCNSESEPNPHFAQSEDEYCVASGSLKAITYWCQGKKKCGFPHNWIIDVGEAREFFVAEETAFSSVSAASAACRLESGSLARPSTPEHWSSIHKLASSPKDVDGFWIDHRVAEDGNLPGDVLWLRDGSSDYEGQCLALLKEPESSAPSSLVLRWLPCHNPDQSMSYSALCETSFGFDPNSRISSSIVDDLSCFDTLQTKVLEYRFHVEEIGRAEVACPMSVDYMRSNTCYKLTSAMSWRDARRQCWRWGGELAFPLNQESEECSTRIYSSREEEIWMASTSTCPDDGNEDNAADDTGRCVVSFADNKAFVAGAYFSTNDLCFPFPRGVDDGESGTLRRGICALPPAKVPRTVLPGYATCPPVDPNDPRWPYDADELIWDVTGIAGETAYKSCPEGQSGSVSWECGADGDWVGEPDTTQCTNVDVDGAIADLQDPDSVPSEVVSDVYEEVEAAGDDLTAGDVLGVVDVVDLAVEVQAERIESVPPEEQEQYTDDFTAETIRLLDDILANPSPWTDIEMSEKSQRLTDIQVDVDELATSLLRYTTYQKQEYLSVNQVLKLQINRDVSEELSYSDGLSSITVRTDENQDEVGAVSFLSYATVGCILAEKDNCTDLFPMPTAGVVDSVVLGATLHSPDGTVIASSFGSGYPVGSKTQNHPVGSFREEEGVNVTVDLDFYYDFDGGAYGLSNITCSYWDVSTSSWSSEGCELVSSDAAHAVCRCDHLTNFGCLLDVTGNLEDNETLNDILTVITIVGCSLSILSLVICLYIFTFVRGLKGDRTSIHRNLCLCLLIAEILLLAGLDNTDSNGDVDGLCYAIAVFLHFFFLAAFAWMFVEGMHVYYMLVKVFDSGRFPSWSYYAIGYGAPAAIVVLCVAIVEITGTHGYGTESYCWLDYENGLIWAFAAPVLLVVMVNTAMFVKALLIARSSISKKNINAKGQFSNKERETKNVLTLVKGSFSLLCILGITWIFGFTYFFEGAEWLSIIFTVLNSLQGVFILLFHVILNDKARKEVRKTLRRTIGRARAFALRQPYETTTASSAANKSGASSKARNANGISSSNNADSSSSDNRNNNYDTVGTLTTSLGKSYEDSGIVTSASISEAVTYHEEESTLQEPEQEQPVRKWNVDTSNTYIRGGGTINVTNKNESSGIPRTEEIELDKQEQGERGPIFIADGMYGDEGSNRSHEA